MALSKVCLGAKHVSYIRESVKTVVEKFVETSVENALDKKSEWTTQAKGIEDAELKQTIKPPLPAQRASMDAEPSCKKSCSLTISL